MRSGPDPSPSPREIVAFFLVGLIAVLIFVAVRRGPTVRRDLYELAVFLLAGGLLFAIIMFALSGGRVL